MHIVTPPAGYKPVSLKGRRDFILPDDLALKAKTPDEYLAMAVAAVPETELHRVAFRMPAHLVPLQSAATRGSAVETECTDCKGVAVGAIAGSVVAPERGTDNGDEQETEEAPTSAHSRRGLLRGALGMAGGLGAFVVLGKVAPQSASAATCNCYTGQYTNPTCDRGYRCYPNGPFGRKAVFDVYAYDVGCSSPCKYVFRAYICC